MSAKFHKGGEGGEGGPESTATCHLIKCPIKSSIYTHICKQNNGIKAATRKGDNIIQKIKKTLQSDNQVPQSPRDKDKIG